MIQKGTILKNGINKYSIHNLFHLTISNKTITLYMGIKINQGFCLDFLKTIHHETGKSNIGIITQKAIKKLVILTTKSIEIINNII